jgi:hypothetical protein
MKWELKREGTMLYLECEEADRFIALTPSMDRPISYLVEEMQAVETLAEANKAA